MAKIFEKSSGGIVYRKIDGKIEVLLLKWLNSKNVSEFVIPKGKIEDGEVAKDTAIREISEEAGFKKRDLEIIKFITKLNYTYTAGYIENNPVIDKDVYLFLVRYNGHDIPKVAKKERFIGYKWVPLDNIEKIRVKFDLQAIISRNKTFFI